MAGAGLKGGAEHRARGGAGAKNENGRGDGFGVRVEDGLRIGPSMKIRLGMGLVKEKHTLIVQLGKKLLK